jgi:hypothetical protein
VAQPATHGACCRPSPVARQRAFAPMPWVTLEPTSRNGRYAISRTKQSMVAYKPVEPRHGWRWRVDPSLKRHTEWGSVLWLFPRGRGTCGPGGDGGSR